MITTVLGTNLQKGNFPLYLGQLVRTFGTRSSLLAQSLSHEALGRLESPENIAMLLLELLFKRRLAFSLSFGHIVCSRLVVKVQDWELT